MNTNLVRRPLLILIVTKIIAIIFVSENLLIFFQKMMSQSGFFQLLACNLFDNDESQKMTHRSINDS